MAAPGPAVAHTPGIGGRFQRRGEKRASGKGGFEASPGCTRLAEPGEEAPAAACLPVSSCCSAAVPLWPTPLLLSHLAGMLWGGKKEVHH